MKYILSGEGASSIFTIDENTGDIHATKRLDREVQAYYTLRAQAVDSQTNRPVEPESEFVVKVQDINDNEPKFPDGPYTAGVSEMSPLGESLSLFPYSLSTFVLVHFICKLLNSDQFWGCSRDLNRTRHFGNLNFKHSSTEPRLSYALSNVCSVLLTFIRSWRLQQLCVLHRDAHFFWSCLIICNSLIVPNFNC